MWQVHEEPYDFFRFTQLGIADMLKQTGFEVDRIVKDTVGIETLAVTLNSYIVDNLAPPIHGFGRLVALTICFPIQLIAMTLQITLPDRRQLYLNLVIQARKGTPL